MCRSLLVVLFASVLAGTSFSQTMDLSSGNLTVLSGTSLRFLGPIEWTISNAATVVNDGTIDLGSEARLIEAEGAPIIGSGSEHAVLEATPPYAMLEPGGLGLSISVDDGPGTVDVTRGHSRQVLHTSDLSIARWFLVSAEGQTGQDLDLELRYDPTELNGLDDADLLLFEALSDVGPWGALPSTVDVDARTVSSTDQYPWAYITAFDRNAVAGSPELNHPDGFVIHPTIVENVLWITATGLEQISTLVIFDGSGRTVQDPTPKVSGPRAQLDLSGLAPGAYFLRLNERYVLRFQKV
ncbi:MAG: T9SS type A sorting domain-containing protein [Flavobacteriales bacterium]|nr:T9SS type A sorting domain-containing protein [Flavobacteriales bacterium]